ncbi:hypothetical protein B296_00054280 [Ensete ventricosum]|uniref:Uncharacterized protein n=1 Tax=Ensete ventricosum TaxID=4639 RepID=A0A426XYX9_ENSVE|nr:hypothetical protein B296_00054280 [Ensete ventricosum]
MRARNYSGGVEPDEVEGIEVEGRVGAVEDRPRPQLRRRVAGDDDPRQFLVGQPLPSPFFSHTDSSSSSSSSAIGRIRHGEGLQPNKEEEGDDDDANATGKRVTPPHSSLFLPPANEGARRRHGYDSRFKKHGEIMARLTETRQVWDHDDRRRQVKIKELVCKERHFVGSDMDGRVASLGGPD